MVHVEHDIEFHTRQILRSLGEDIEREGLLETPRRMAQSLRDLTSGYSADLDSKLTTFAAEGDELIVAQNIPVHSLCEHHVLPFVGFAHIGYIPEDSILGLSKFARIVDHYSRRLQVQERLTTQIADKIEEAVSPQGVMVVVEAEHFCMTLRGVQAPGTRTTTSAIRGVFRDDQKSTKSEFLSLIGKG